METVLRMLPPGSPAPVGRRVSENLGGRASERKTAASVSSGLQGCQYHAQVSVDDRAGADFDVRDIAHQLDNLVEDLAAVLGPPKITPAEHDRDLDLVARDEETAGVADFGMKIVGVDVGPQLDLLYGDAGLFLAGFLGFLRGLESMLAPVQDADHDGPGIRGYFDQVEAGFGCNPAGFIECDDADLFTLDPYQSDWAETDLIVDSDSIVDSPPPFSWDAPAPDIFQ